jgi:signal transduction histidine kinase
LPDNPEKLKVLGNEQLLHLAFSNVILNAYKYSNNQEVRVLLSVEETSIVIEVQDNGVGIPKDELQYIYDPFWRGSNTKNFEGYGIGLPLTRNIIKIHNGEIIVISEKNKGTIVLLKIPLKTEAQ